MCIECIRHDYPGKDLIFTDYDGPVIHMGEYDNAAAYEKFISDNFNGALPFTIDFRLVGTFIVKDES